MKFLYGRDLISKTARTLNQVQLQNLDMFSLTLTLARSLSLHLPLSHFPHLVEGILKVETFPEKRDVTREKITEVEKFNILWMLNTKGKLRSYSDKDISETEELTDYWGET